MPPSNYSKKTKTKSKKPETRSRLPVGSHRMPDGSVMKDKDMPSKKSTTKSTQKKIKKDFSSCDTSCAGSQPSYSKPNDLDVEGSIKKDKEVKEKDVFDFSSQ